MTLGRASSEIAHRGFAFVGGAELQAMLEATARGALADVASFADSWDDLCLDRYMADGGRYRRRRHALFDVPARGPVARKVHGPHFQGLEYNPLNGGVARWFEAISEPVAASRTLGAILELARQTFGRLSPNVEGWDVEVHQFRIEAVAGAAASPTPEGVHRDGVDWVLALLVRRVNIASGTTTIHDPTGEMLGCFTLTEPFDAAWIDDRRCWHGVTPVEPVDATKEAHRDVLVVTFRARPSAASDAPARFT